MLGYHVSIQKSTPTTDIKQDHTYQQKRTDKNHRMI